LKRKILQKMIDWKNSKNDLPLMLAGIKGVGKSYLALDFSKLFFEMNLYINFETDYKVRILFEEYDSSKEGSMLDILSEYYDIPISFLASALIILDEVTVSNKVMSAVDCLISEDDCPMCILITSTISSLTCTSEFHFLMVEPMEFDEFLTALGSEWYVEVIQGHYLTNKKIPDIVHQEMLNIFQDYLKVGGMPDAVNEYLRMESLHTIPQIHKNLFVNYKMLLFGNDEEGDALKRNQIFDILASQLCKNNKKFQFSYIRKGATYNIYKSAFETLLKNKYVIDNVKAEIELIGKNECLAPKAGQFRLYPSDVGILNSLILSDESGCQLQEKERVQILLESYLVQELKRKGYQAYFWESTSQAKVDIIIEHEDGIVPIEIKISEHSRSKSLSVLKGLHEIPYSIRVSSRNFEVQGNVKNIPYYALFCM